MAGRQRRFYGLVRGLGFGSGTGYRPDGLCAWSIGWRRSEAGVVAAQRCDQGRPRRLGVAALAWRVAV